MSILKTHKAYISLTTLYPLLFPFFPVRLPRDAELLGKLRLVVLFLVPHDERLVLHTLSLRVIIPPE